MNLINKFRAWLYDPRVRGVNVDDTTFLDIHSSILKEKPLLRSAFQAFYHDMSSCCDRYLTKKGTELELGTGAGFFKSLRPNLITSDIRKAPNIDIELDAQNMSLQDETVRCIYAINVFHHLPNPDAFFNELCRVLLPGGGCILIEPHIGFASALLHRHMHTNERFEPNAPNWDSTTIGGPLSGANQALAHIVFIRDLEKFKMLYGQHLEIVFQGYSHNALRYLFSGGLNFRQLLPSKFEPLLRFVEWLGTPFARYWSLHQIIVIRKR